MYFDVCEPLFWRKQAGCLVWLVEGSLTVAHALDEPRTLARSVFLSLIQGRPLSYKTFLIWVLISIYQGKDGWKHLLSYALALAPGSTSPFSRL